jgi:hypothetical protein
MIFYLCGTLNKNDNIFSLLRKTINDHEKISEAEQLLIKKRHKVINPLTIEYKDNITLETIIKAEEIESEYLEEVLKTIVDINIKLISECSAIAVSGDWYLVRRNSFYHTKLKKNVYNVKKIWKDTIWQR